MPDVWTLAAIITKFVLYLGILTATGTVLVALIFRLDRCRGLAFGFAGLGFVATILGFSLRGANLTGDVGGMTDPEMLGLLWSTTVGTALILRICGLGLLVAGLYFGRFGLGLSVLGGGIAVWSFGVVGHVPEQGSKLLDIALLLHLIAVSLWIGILTPLKRLASMPATYEAAADLGHRFAGVATIAVPTLIFLGLYMSYGFIGSLAALFGSGYGQALVLKITLVACLLGLAAANKFRFVPDLRSGNQTAASRLSKSITIEWVIVLVILSVTAVLTSNLNLPV